MSFFDSLGTAIGAYLKPAVLAEIKVVGDALVVELQKLGPQLEAKIEAEIGIIAPKLIPIIENEAIKVGKDVEDHLPAIADGVAKTIVDAVLAPLNNLINKIPGLPNFPGF